MTNVYCPKCRGEGQGHAGACLLVRETMPDDTNPKDALGDKKVNLALVPPASIIHEAMAMENGAKKYDPYNWRSKKVRATVYVAACMRHLLEYLDGASFSSDTDPPVHHLGHAKACLGIVLDALETGNLIDDRPAPGAASRLVARETPRNVISAHLGLDAPVRAVVVNADDLSRRDIETLGTFSNEHDAIAQALDAAAGATSPFVPILCPDGALPDGETCPRCGERRCPSGVDGGSWVHCPPEEAC